MIREVIGMGEKYIGKRIQQFRKAKGLTQEELAEMIGITPNYLSTLERGVYNIKNDLLIKIMNSLEITANDIFCDVMTSGYKVRASRLADIMEDLPQEDQKRIMTVVEAMIEALKNK